MKSATRSRQAVSGASTAPAPTLSLTTLMEHVVYAQTELPTVRLAAKTPATPTTSPACHVYQGITLLPTELSV